MTYKFSKLAHNDVNKEILETDIIALSELSESEVRNHPKLVVQNLGCEM